MKILCLSDLHMDHYFWSLPKDLDENSYDVVVLAGDIMAPPLKGLEWAHNTFKKPVIYISGNHEYYGYDIKIENDRILDFYDLENIYYLNRYQNWVVLDGVLFVGSTLWTDFNLYDQQEESMKVSKKYMNDYNFIKDNGNLVDPEDLLLEHALDRSALFNEVDAFKKDDKIYKTVVVTHHMPHPDLIAKKYGTDLLNASFCSDLSRDIEILKPDLWLFGHTHCSIDQYIGKTRFVCNPRGYGKENPDFNPTLIVEI